MTALIKAIKAVLLFQILLLGLWLFSFELFINAEVAFFSAFFIMMGSMYSYKSLVSKRLAGYEDLSEDDLIDKIDDPYDLYSEDVEMPEGEEVDLKAVVKEEKARLKGHTTKNMATAAPAMVSMYRMGGYLLLVVGFIGLKNNDLLSLWPYMIALSVGVLGGFVVGKGLFTTSRP